MKLAEAIEILEELHTISHDGKDPDWRGAIKLGTEAIKCVQNAREDTAYNIQWPLPGENKE